MNPLAKILLAAVALCAASSADAARSVKGRYTITSSAKNLVVRRSLLASRKAYDSVFDQRKRYLDQQEDAAFKRYECIKEADERRINAHYVTTGKWLDASPSVDQAYQAYRAIRETPRP